MNDAAALIPYHKRPERLGELLGDVLDAARRQGADEACASAGANTGLSVSVRMGELQTIEHHQSKSLSVTVYFDKRLGAATSTEFSARAIEETVEAACRIARYTQRDEFAGLPDRAHLATDIPDVDLCHPWHLDPQRATDIALESENAAREADARITNSEGAMVSDFEGSHYFANSLGFLAGYPLSYHSVSCVPIAEANGEKQRDHWRTVSRRTDNLLPPAVVGKTAAERALRRLGSRQTPTCSAPVLFVPDQAMRLFYSLISAVQGTRLYRKSSFLVDHAGKQIFPAGFDIEERPHLPGAIASAPFDAEGVTTRDRDFVKDGVLQGYMLDSYAARKLSLEPTGNAGGNHNLVVKPGGMELADLIRTLHKGLIVTEVMGMGVNIVTGDYSRGVAGFWVEGGEIQYPVQEITIASNLKDMFKGIREVGKDVDARFGIRTGSVLIERMTIAGA